MASPTYLPATRHARQAPPSGHGWLHEIKYDGYRIGCRIRDGRTTLISRNGKDWTPRSPMSSSRGGQAPDVRRAHRRRGGHGAARWAHQLSAAAGRGHRQRCARDARLLRLRSAPPRRRPMTSLPLAERKARLLRSSAGRTTGRIRLRRPLSKGAAPRFSRRPAGSASRASSPKRIDRRTARPARRLGENKCVQQQEFVDRRLHRSRRDARGPGGAADRLLRWRPAGLRRKGRHRLYAQRRRGLSAGGWTPSSRSSCPFDPPRAPDCQTAHWVKPHLVCEVLFTEWTDRRQDSAPGVPRVARSRQEPSGRANRKTDSSARRRTVGPSPVDPPKRGRDLWTRRKVGRVLALPAEKVGGSLWTRQHVRRLRRTRRT